MISRPTSNAALCLATIARAGSDEVTVNRLAEDTGLSRATVARAVHALGRSGLISTRRGVGGGVTLEKPPSKITLFDLCEVFRDPALDCVCMFWIDECATDGVCPEDCPCVVQQKRKINFLRRTTILDVARMVEPRLRPPQK